MRQASVRTIAVSGEAGSGKTTLGRALARELRLPLIDLDSVTNPLLDALPAQEHWLRGPDAALIRAGRYAALRAVARDAIESAGGAVLVAPFTDELRGGEAWRLLRADCGPLTMLRLVGDPALIAARRAERGAERDAHRDPAAPPTRVGAPVLEIDARLATAAQLDSIRGALGALLQSSP